MSDVKIEKICTDDMGYTKVKMIAGDRSGYAVWVPGHWVPGDLCMIEVGDLLYEEIGEAEKILRERERTP